MLQQPKWLLAGLLCLALSLAPAAPAQSPTPTVRTTTELVLGRVSEDPKAHFDELKPLLDYVVPRMASVGIRSGRILMAKDLQQMSSYLRRGRVDWVNESAGNAGLLERRGIANALLVAERDGVVRYHSLIFVRRDSPIRQLSDLAGRSIAFQRPGSTSAYYLPASVLLDAGMPLEPLQSPMDKPGTGAVGYVFGRTEINITTWVHKGFVDAGVLSNLDWVNPRRMPPELARDFRILHATAEVPRALMMARSGLDPKVSARLREVLLEASSDPEAAEVLRNFGGTSRLIPLSPADDAAIGRLGKDVERVQTEVE